MFHRTLQLGGGHVKVLGLGEVCTRSTARRQGAATRLLESLLGCYANNDRDVAMLLHTSRPHLQAYYAKFGFRSLPVPFYQASVFMNDVTPDEQASIAPWVREESMDAFLLAAEQIYDSQRHAHSGFVVRSSAYWQRWVKAYIAHGHDVRLYSQAKSTTEVESSLRSRYAVAQCKVTDGRGMKMGQCS